MMDFFVREAREIVDGSMFIIRFGTCGTVNPKHEVGTFAINAEGAILVQRCPNHFIEKNSSEPAYRMSKPCFPDHHLTETLISSVKEFAAKVPLVTSMNATCDSFYSSQGRMGRYFIDDNETILKDLVVAYPKISTLDMETCHLFHLAECVKDKANHGIKASALKIIVANRTTDTFLIDEDAKRSLEKIGGLACLEALRQHFS